MKHQTIRLGTRGSKLALIQARIVGDALRAAHPGLDVENVIITTSGDWKKTDGETALKADQGGKGLFIKEIEHALLEGHIDCGVHSLKDVPAVLPSEFEMVSFLEREDPRDCLISAKEISSIDDIDKGASLGTASMRRQSMILSLRPDLKPEVIRGNVDTRLDKIYKQQVDISFLAVAGLMRMGLGEHIKYIFDIDDILPAAGQGVVALEMLKGNEAVKMLLRGVNSRDVELSSIAERALLEALSASCHTPVGSYAVWGDGGMLHLRGYLGSLDGVQNFTIRQGKAISTAQEAHAFGFDVGGHLKDKVPSSLLLELGLCVPDASSQAQNS